MYRRAKGPRRAEEEEPEPPSVLLPHSTKQVTFLLRPRVSEGGGGEGRRERKAVMQECREIQIE